MKTESNTTQMLMARIEEAEHKRDEAHALLWQDCYRRYRSIPRPKATGSNIFVPNTFMQCEVIKARIRETIFAQRPYISAVPVEGGDVRHADNMELLLDWQMNERMDITRLIGEEAATSLVVYGTAVVYTGWQVRQRTVTHAACEPRPLLDARGDMLGDDKGEPLLMDTLAPVTVRSKVYDDPMAVNIPLSDFFVDADATTVEDARFCGHREYQTKEELRSLEQEGKYTIDWERAEAYEADPEDSFEAGHDKSRLEVHHYWEDDRHVVILARDQIICDEPNPFWHGMKPYDKACYVYLPDEFYGMGIPEILAGLQDELNTARNQRIDYNSMALRRMWKLRRGCGLTARDLVWRQNGVLQVENMDDVAEINIQDLPSGAFANETAIKQDMQDTTGCQDILMGISYANETATTTMTRDNNASLRFKSIITGIIRDLLVPVARKCASMDQQFMSHIRSIRLLGEDAGFRSISPYDLAGDFDIIFCGSAAEPSAARQQDKEKALQAYSLALADPAYARDDSARLRLFRRVLEALDIKDAAAMMPEEAPAAAEQKETEPTATVFDAAMPIGQYGQQG